ncbi:MAG: MlaD family protein [Chlamydiota bacterium]
MVDYIKNMLIGLFVLVACALIVGIILFLEPTVGDGKETLIVRFSNINGLSVGTRVMFAGKPVGEVVAIEQIKQARKELTDEMGQVYFYQLILHVDSSVHVFNTDEITIQTSGLMGEKSIAIIPRSPPKGVKPAPITAAVPVYADSIDPLESAFNQLSRLSEKLEGTLDNVIAWIDQNGQRLGAAIRSFDEAMYEASTALSRVNKTDLIGEIQSGIENFSTAMRDIGYTVDRIHATDLFENLGITIRNARNASYLLGQLTDYIALGKGTIGKLLVDDDTYLRLTAILSKHDTMMNDVNHYGFLFNLNKEWQRTRLKQATVLNALNTPQNFRDYFNKEIDLINTSMSRLSMLIERAENSPERKKIFETNLFQKDFAELLRCSQALYDNLKLYNQQLMRAEQTTR